MTNSTDKSQAGKSPNTQERIERDDEQDGSDKDNAAGKHSESSYPNDDYWENPVREDPKESPAEPAKPEHGYRWEPAEEGESSDTDESS